MGKEARCTARSGRKTFAARALLESQALLVRGDAERLVVSLTPQTRAAAKRVRDWLHVGAVALQLGEAPAQAWLTAITSPKTVLEKLGVKPGLTVKLTGAVPETLAQQLQARGATVVKRALDDSWHIVAVTTPSALARLPKLGPQGVLWLLRPKGPTTPVPEALTRGAARAAGLVDVKVVSFSETLSAEKYVRRR